MKGMNDVLTGCMQHDGRSDYVLCDREMLCDRSVLIGGEGPISSLVYHTACTCCVTAIGRKHLGNLDQRQATQAVCVVSAAIGRGKGGQF